MKKVLCAFICAVLSFSALTSCGTPDDASHTEVKVFNRVIDETKFNIIEADGTSKFNIVRAENAGSSVLTACMDLKDAILEYTGVELEVKSDFEKKGHPEFQRQDHEILVGFTNREESEIAGAELVKARDFSIVQSGTRLSILAKDGAGVQLAVDYFIDNYIDKTNCCVATPVGENFVSKYDYPVDSFTLNGTDISEYQIAYGDAYNEQAKTIYSFVYENYGVVLSTTDGKVTSDHVISLHRDDLAPFKDMKDTLHPLEKRVDVAEGYISVYSGIILDPANAVDEFVNKYFVYEDIPEKIDITIENSSVIEENKYIRIDDTEILSEIDKKAVDRREYITNTPNNFADIPEDFKGRVFYISADGDDSADGKSEETAWASIDKLNISVLLPGDIVLFRRGDEFRGKIKGSNGVTYSAYGTGPKPIINGSKRNFADPDLWYETDVENVYKSAYNLDNVGNVVFNYSGKTGNYDELIGQLRIVGAGDFTGYKDLSKDLEFTSDLNTKEFYLYSAEGNPGDRFESIEICEGGNLFQGSNRDVTVDNLMFIFGGAHGVGTGTVENRTVQNCIFAWIGGSILKGYNGANLTRYGNAVEVYGGCDGYYVYDNWIYQIYDTGITHQYSTDDKVIVMDNIEYRGNLVELCHWSIEYYNRGSMPGSRLYNVHVHDNMTLYGCYGWGSVGREGGGALHNSFTIIDDVSDYLVENNIFAYSKGNIVRYNEGGDRKINFKNNTYVQYYGRALGYMFGKTQPYNATAVTQLAEVMKEQDPVVVFLMNDEERKAEELAKKEVQELNAAKTELEQQQKKEEAAEFERQKLAELKEMLAN